MKKFLLLVALLMVPAVSHGDTNFDSNGSLSTLANSDYFPNINGENNNVTWGTIKNIVKDTPTLDVTHVSATGLKLNNTNFASTNSILSYNGNQYATFWNSDATPHLVMGKRSLPNGIWTFYVYDGTGGRATISLTGNDNHDGASLGVDSGGFIHVCYGMHGSALLYRKSSSAQDVSSLGSAISMVGTNESQVTYPMFFKDNNNVLFFTFRDGASGAGDTYLYKYTVGSTTWTAAAGTGTGGKWIDGKTGSYNAYITFPAIDSNNFAHFQWHWRNTSGANTENILYAKYDCTNGGFYKSTGVAYVLPITKTNAEVADTVAVALNVSGVQSDKSIDVDSSGNVHTAYLKDDANGNAQVWYTKNTAGVWSTPQQLTQFPTHTTSTIGNPAQYEAAIWAPIVLTDSNDYIYLFYYSFETSDGLNVIKSTDGGTTWKYYALPVGSLANFRYNMDQWAWKDSKEIYMLFQIVPELLITYNRSPVYLMHWKPSDAIYAVPHVSKNIYAYDDIEMRSAGGNVILKSDTLGIRLGRIWFISTAENLTTAVAAAATGDTLILDNGTFTITANQTITKALTFIGQGPGRTIVNTVTSALAMFNISVNDVIIKDMSISSVATGTSKAINVNGTASNVVTGCLFENLRISMGSSNGTQVGIQFTDASGVIKNTDINVTSANGVAFGVYAFNASTAEATDTVNIYNTRSTISANTGTTAAFAVEDSSSSNPMIMNVYDSTGIGTNTGSATIAGASARLAANAQINLYGGQFSGSTADILQASSGVTTSYGASLLNKTTSGTISSGGMTILPLTNFTGNVGVGTMTPGVALDVVGSLRLNGTGSGAFRVQAAANQVCTTTCTTGKALAGLDAGTLGAVLPALVGPADATADYCLCGS